MKSRPDCYRAENGIEHGENKVRRAQKEPDGTRNDTKADMTPKEKRELEKKKLKQMTFPQKVEYIWAYYKLHMAIALAIILVIVFVDS